MDPLDINASHFTHTENYTTTHGPTPIHPGWHIVPVYGLGEYKFLLIHVTSLLALSCSVLTSLVLLTFLYYKRRGSFFNQSIGDRLVVYLAVCDLSFGISHTTDHAYIVYHEDFPPDRVCKIFAFFLTEFNLASSFIVAFTAFNAMVMVVFRRKFHLGKYDWKLNLAAFGIPAIFGVVGVSLELLGPSGAWCHVDFRNPHGPLFNNIFSMIIFSSFCTNVICYIAILIRIRATERKLNINSNRMKIAPSNSDQTTVKEPITQISRVENELKSSHSVISESRKRSSEDKRVDDLRLPGNALELDNSNYTSASENLDNEISTFEKCDESISRNENPIKSNFVLVISDAESTVQEPRSESIRNPETFEPAWIDVDPTTEMIQQNLKTKTIEQNWHSEEIVAQNDNLEITDDDGMMTIKQDGELMIGETVKGQKITREEDEIIIINGQKGREEIVEITAPANSIPENKLDTNFRIKADEIAIYHEKEADVVIDAESDKTESNNMRTSHFTGLITTSKQQISEMTETSDKINSCILKEDNNTENNSDIKISNSEIPTDKTMKADKMSVRENITITGETGTTVETIANNEIIPPRKVTLPTDISDKTEEAETKKLPGSEANVIDTTIDRKESGNETLQDTYQSRRGTQIDEEMAVNSRKKLSIGTLAKTATVFPMPRNISTVTTKPTTAQAKGSRYDKTAKVVMVFVAVYVMQFWAVCVFSVWALIDEPPVVVFWCAVLFTNLGGVLNLFAYIIVKKRQTSVRPSENDSATNATNS